jgi:hypothetical protein
MACAIRTSNVRVYQNSTIPAFLELKTTTLAGLHARTAMMDRRASPHIHDAIVVDRAVVNLFYF